MRKKVFDMKIISMTLIKFMCLASNVIHRRAVLHVEIPGPTAEIHSENWFCISSMYRVQFKLWPILKSKRL